MGYLTCRGNGVRTIGHDCGDFVKPAAGPSAGPALVRGTDPAASGSRGFDYRSPKSRGVVSTEDGMLAVI